MKLHSPQFERAVKRLVRQTIESSPELMSEQRRNKRHRKNASAAWFARLSWSCLAGFAVWNIQEKTGHLTTALAGVGVYLIGALCFRITSLWTKLYGSPEGFILMQLPVPTGDVFRWLWQRYFRESLFLVVDLFVMLGALAWLNNFTVLGWLGVPLFVAVAWLSILGLAVVCVLRLPRAPFQMMAVGWIVMLVAVLFGQGTIGPALLRLLDNSALVLNQVLPTSWGVAPFELLAESHHWWLLLTWLPVVFLLGILKPCLALLRNRLVYEEVQFPAASDQLPEAEVVADPVPDTGKKEHLPAAEVEAIVASGSFLKQPSHPLRRLPERVLWAWLNPRERALADFVHPAGLSIGGIWKIIYLVLLATCLSQAVIGLFSPFLQWVTLGLGTFMMFCMVLASIMGHGRAFTPTWCSGVNVPMYASYGLGYKEMAGFFLKYSTIQVPFLVGAFVIQGGVVAWCLKLPITMGLVFGFKTAGLFFFGRFVALVFAFSSGTNDSTRFRFSSVLLMGNMVVLGLLFFILGGASLFVPDSVPAFFLWLGALFDAWLFFWVYGWFYRFCRFDLMNQPKQ